MVLVNTRGGLFGQTGRGGGVFSSEQRGFGAADYGLADRDRHLSDHVVNVRGGVFGPGGHGGGVFDYATAFGAVGAGSINAKKLTSAIFAAQAKDKQPDIGLAASVAGNALSKARGNDKGGDYAKVVKKALDKGKAPLSELLDPKYYTDLTQRLTSLANASEPTPALTLDASLLQDEYASMADSALGVLATKFGFKGRDAKIKGSETTRDPKTWGSAKANGVLTSNGGIVRPPDAQIYIPCGDWQKAWGACSGGNVPRNSPLWDWFWGQAPEDQAAFLKKYKTPSGDASARKSLVALPGWFRSYYSIAKAEAAQLIAERAAAVAVKIPVEQQKRNWWPWIIAAGVATVGVGVLVGRERKAGAV